ILVSVANLGERGRRRTGSEGTMELERSSGRSLVILATFVACAGACQRTAVTTQDAASTTPLSDEEVARSKSLTVAQLQRLKTDYRLSTTDLALQPAERLRLMLSSRPHDSPEGAPEYWRRDH